MMHDLALSGYSLGIRTVPPAQIEFRPRLTVKRIQETVADYYGINRIHMTGESKCQRHAHPRQVAMYLARELLGRSMPDIGMRFGDRDHTTVLHALRCVSKRLKTNDDLAEDVRTLKKLVRE
jgi:chromosomal replication initiator protein